MGGGVFAGNTDSGCPWPKTTPLPPRNTMPKPKDPVISVGNTHTIFVVPPYELNTIPPQNNVDDEFTIGYSNHIIVPPTIAQALQIRFEQVDALPKERKPVSPKLLAELAGKAAARV